MTGPALRKSLRKAEQERRLVEALTTTSNMAVAAKAAGMSERTGWRVWDRLKAARQAQQWRESRRPDDPASNWVGTCYVTVYPERPPGLTGLIRLADK
jgi:hypothetical protein